MRDLGQRAAGIVAEVVPMPAGTHAITFVPPDGDRSLRRGHHPPARLARELGRRWGLPVRPLLERTRPLRPQRGLGRRERQQNVRGAFRARGITVQVRPEPFFEERLVKTYQPYWAVRAHLFRQLHREKEARQAFDRAIGLAEDPAVRRFLLERRGGAVLSERIRS